MASKSPELKEALLLQQCGVAVWHFLGVSVLHTAWSLIQRTPLGIFGFAMLYFSQLLVLASLNLIKRVSEPSPIHHPKFGLSRCSLASLVASRLLFLGRNLKDLIGSLLFHGACLFSSTIYMTSFVGGSSWSLTYALILSLAFSSSYLILAREALTFPVIQRKRFFRMKHCLSAVARSALQLTALSTLLSLLIAALYPSTRPPSLPTALSTLSTALLAACCWHYGAQTLSVVLTERLPLLLFNLPAVMEAMRGEDAVLQEVALLELSCAVEDRSSRGRKLRWMMFSDSSGAVYLRPLLGFCRGEVEVFAGGVARSLPSKPGDTQSREGATVGPVKWNAPSSTASLKLPPPDQGAVHWLIRGSFQRQTLCIRTLTALMTASLEEDVYAVMQLSQPGLFECLAVLLSCVLVLQQYRRQQSALSVLPVLPWRCDSANSSSSRQQQSHVDPAAAALEDVAVRAIHLVAYTFRRNVQELVVGVQKVKGPLPYGSCGEAAALLQSIAVGME